MSVVRPLPARPSLEYARKEAKALLRRLRANNPDARLSDAQLILAREHGFASWPKLVRYMGDVERQERGHIQLQGDRSHFEGNARELLAQHGARSIVVGRTLAAYVPRFYGLSIEDVFAHEVHEDEARLAVARRNGAPSWEVLLERVEQDVRSRRSAWEIDPIRRAANAMEAGDVRALERIVEAHPELLHPFEYEIAAGHTLMWAALVARNRQGDAVTQPVMDWLAAHGLVRQQELDLRLCGHMGMSVDDVNDLLARGANPSWVAPNGIPVLEHALLRYWNGDAVDVLAARTTPRDAFWIAAGLGDVNGVRRFLDRDGKPTTAARRMRPDVVAVGARGFMPQLPDADDEEILVEAMLVAMLNGRTKVIEYLASRGAPVNSVIYGRPLITIAAANGMVAVVGALVRCGADIDLRGWAMKETAREMACELFLSSPDNTDRRRILEIFGMDPDALAAQRDAGPAAQPVHHPNLRRALMFATADAVNRGQTDVGLENLLFGLLRTEKLALGFANAIGQMDVERLHADFADRLGVAEPSADDANLPLSRRAQAALDAATAHATAHRSDAVGELELLQQLLRDDNGSITELLERYGADVPKLVASIDHSLGRMGPIRVSRKRKY